MMTEIELDGVRFLINGRPTYEGVTYRGRSVEGLLFNSRMVQAIFDDENPETAVHWTGRWDPDRNTDEFCAALPEYRRRGLLAVTVGLQGGGSIYTPEIYDHYLNLAYEPDGALKPAYFERLGRVLQAADAAGMVVIVNYFYWKQAARLESGAVIDETGAPTKKKVSPVQMSPETQAGLVGRLRLVYNGQQRLAKNLLRAVMGRWMARDPEMAWIQRDRPVGQGDARCVEGWRPASCQRLWLSVHCP